MKRKHLISTMVMFVFAVATVNAQPNFGANGPKSRNPEVIKYMQENVFPMMKIQHNELDKELTAKEKTRITEIRAELVKLHQARIEKRREMRDDNQKPTLEQRKEMREMRNKMTTLMDEVEIMAENHDATITRLLDEIGGEIEQWKSDLAGIRDANCPQGLNCPNNQDGNMNRGQGRGMGPGAGNGRGFGPHGGRGDRPGREDGPGNDIPLQRIFTPEGFLLWNPAEPLPIEMAADDADGLQLNIFPNPAKSNVQISVMLTTDSQVSVNIIDKQGNDVQQIKAEQAKAGLFTKTVDVSKLNAGLYFVKVKAGNESALQRLIVEN